MKAKILVKITLLIGLVLIGNGAKSQDQFKIKSNPVIPHQFAADPAVLVHKKRLYLYVSEDKQDARPDKLISHNWLVFSTTDMKTWKEHPVPLDISIFKWALEDDAAWSSHVVEKNGRFYWYASIGSFSNRPKMIGVAVSDAPTGPFEDALGKPLIPGDFARTPMKWGNVDPAVIVDDGGHAYIFWGGGECFYAKLKDNMIELDGIAQPVKLPMFSTGSWVHKYKGKYYLSYTQRGNPSMTGYAISDKMDGPWDYVGIISVNLQNNLVYQSAIIKFRNQWYFFYHQDSTSSDDLPERTICMEHLDYYKDGMIKRVKMTKEGIFQSQ